MVSLRRRMENRKSGGVKKFYKPQNRPDKADFVFGINPVTETLKSEKEIDKILLLKEMKHGQEIEALARNRGIPVQKVPVEKLNRITGKNHQGAIAFISSVNYAQLSNVVTSVFEEGEIPLVLILDRVTDVRNFGAISRSAECSGVHAIVVPFRGSAQINSDAMKTSSGALNFIPVCRETDLLNTVSYLKNSGFQVVSCTEKGSDLVYDVDYTLPTAIIMGSEEDGISDALIEASDYKAQIPLKGKVESLNVSVAAGVIMFEAVRQRG